MILPRDAENELYARGYCPTREAAHDLVTSRPLEAINLLAIHHGELWHEDDRASIEDWGGADLGGESA